MTPFDGCHRLTVGSRFVFDPIEPTSTPPATSGQARPRFARRIVARLRSAARASVQGGGREAVRGDRGEEAEHRQALAEGGRADFPLLEPRAVSRLREGLQQGLRVLAIQISALSAPWLPTLTCVQAPEDSRPSPVLSLEPCPRDCRNPPLASPGFKAPRPDLLAQPVAAFSVWPALKPPFGRQWTVSPVRIRSAPLLPPSSLSRAGGCRTRWRTRASSRSRRACRRARRPPASSSRPASRGSRPRRT
jgi:hypothetical protein